MALHEVGSNNPDGIEIKANKDPVTHIPVDGIPFHPYYTREGYRRRGGIPDRLLRRSYFSCLKWAAISWNITTSFLPIRCRRRDHIAPVWYFTPYYSMLRAVTVNFLWMDAKLWGIVADGRFGGNLRPPALAGPQPGKVDPLQGPAISRLPLHFL